MKEVNQETFVWKSYWFHMRTLRSDIDFIKLSSLFYQTKFLDFLFPSKRSLFFEFPGFLATWDGTLQTSKYKQSNLRINTCENASQHLGLTKLGAIFCILVVPSYWKALKKLEHLWHSKASNMLPCCLWEPEVFAEIFELDKSWCNVTRYRGTTRTTIKTLTCQRWRTWQKWLPYCTLKFNLKKELQNDTGKCNTLVNKSGNWHQINYIISKFTNQILITSPKLNLPVIKFIVVLMSRTPSRIKISHNIQFC